MRGQKMKFIACGMKKYLVRSMRYWFTVRADAGAVPENMIGAKFWPLNQELAWKPLHEILKQRATGASQRRASQGSRIEAASSEFVRNLEKIWVWGLRAQRSWGTPKTWTWTEPFRGMRAFVIVQWPIKIRLINYALLNCLINRLLLVEASWPIA